MPQYDERWTGDPTRNPSSGQTDTRTTHDPTVAPTQAVTGTAAIQAIAVLAGQASLTFSGSGVAQIIAITSAAGAQAFSATVVGQAIATFLGSGDVASLSIGGHGDDIDTIRRRPHHPDAEMETEILALLVS